VIFQQYISNVNHLLGGIEVASGQMTID